MADERVSETVVRRLPLYYRCLKELMAQGVERTSSQLLAQTLGLTASQIRQDLNCFGALGQQGFGYRTRELAETIASILGTDKRHDAVTVGAGHIGKAISRYPGFREEGVHVRAMFDLLPSQVNPDATPPILHISDLEGYLKSHPADIGIIATPASAAQATANALIASGIRAIWNFAPTTLSIPPHIAVNDMHLGDSLLVLLYHLNA